MLNSERSLFLCGVFVFFCASAAMFVYEGIRNCGDGAVISGRGLWCIPVLFRGLEPLELTLPAFSVFSWLSTVRELN